jgi:hypothetical protein
MITLRAFARPTKEETYMNINTSDAHGRIHPTANWDIIAKPRPKPTIFGCRACAEEWTARVGVQGWNRCPHCGRVHNARELL